MNSTSTRKSEAMSAKMHEGTTQLLLITRFHKRKEIAADKKTLNKNVVHYKLREGNNR